MMTVKSKTIFYHFFHNESVSFAVRNYLLSCYLSNPNNLVIVFLVCSTNKSLGLSIKGTSVYTRTLLVYLLVNNYIKSYKIKEIFGKVFIAD